MSKKQTEDEHIKRMAELLRQGTTLMDLACPVCASPLFKLRSGDIWCAKCEKKVLVIKQGEEHEARQRSIAIGTLEAMLMSKIQDVQKKMEREESLEELQKLSTLLSGLLENLEKTRRPKGE